MEETAKRVNTQLGKKGMDMKIIGLTGGVGAGKSSVLAWMKEAYGAYIIVTDEVGHRLMEPGGASYERLVEAYGPGILGGDGTIQRKQLANIVFRDEESVAKINAIVHPLVKQAVLEEIRRAEESGQYPYAVVESALLKEGGLLKLCDTVWYLYASADVRVQRLMASRGYTKERCVSVMDRQLPETAFRRMADAVIDNSGNFEETKRQIARLLG